MSNISDNELDNLFQQAAAGFSEPFDESMWTKLEGKLPSHTGGLIYYKQMVVGIGVIAALIASLLYFSPGVDNGIDKPQEQSAIVSQDDSEIANQEQAVQPVKSKESKSLIARGGKSDNQPISNDYIDIGAKKSKPIAKDKENASTGTLNNTYVNQGNSYPGTVSDKNDIPFLDPLFETWDYPYALPNVEFEQVNLSAENQDNEQKTKKLAKLAIKAMYSPDLSSVGYFSPDKPGSNFGLIAEVYLANRWYVSTGAIISLKIYNTNEGFESYSTQYAADYVEAECRVLDIPLNIGYSVFKNENHGFYLSTGLSSYIMLSEDYQFESGGYYPNKWSENYTNENNHYFGILNLSMGYERKISRQFFIQLEPFLKAPLVGVGEGKVDLVSSGAMFNLKYVFSKSNRP